MAVRIPKFQCGDGIYIKWLDPKGFGPSWVDIKEAGFKESIKPATFETRGYYLWEEKDFIVLCGSYGDEGASDLLALPKGCITKIRKEKR